MSMIFRLAAAVGLVLASAAASAANWDDMFKIRGYGTLGVAHSDEDQADFVIDPLMQSKGAGHSDEWSTTLDSRLGLQIDAQLTDRLFGVVQLVSEGVSNNTWSSETNPDYRPSLEWANLSYRVTDNLTVRGGRIVLPFLSVSEFRKVGFAQHWVRPPVDVYGSIPFTSSDGLDVTYRSDLGGAKINTVRVHYGYQTLRSDVTKSQVEAWGVNDTIEAGALTVRAAYLRVNFEHPGPGFGDFAAAFAGLAGTVPGGQTAAAKAIEFQRLLDVSEPQHIDHYGVGFTYDPSDWFVMGELMRMENDGAIGSSTSGYVSGGMRFGSFTPYAIYARNDAKDRRNDFVVPLAGLPEPIAAMGAGLNEIFGSFTNFNTSQQTMSVGVRWDFMQKFALKAQYDHVNLDDDAYGMLANRQPGFEPGGSLDVFSITMDYVF